MGSPRLALVGAFVIGGLLLFAVGLFMIGDRRLLFTESFEAVADFGNVNGVEVGTSVRLSGLAAGEVIALTLPPDPGGRFLVRMRIREDLRPLIRTDSEAAILTDGLLGAAFIELRSGSPDAPTLEDGGPMQGVDAVQVADLIAEGRETFRVVADEMVAMQGRVQGTFDDLGATVDATTDLIRDVGVDVREVGSASVLLVDSARGVMDEAQRLVEGVAEGEGTAGRLLTDDTLYTHLTGVARETEATMRAVRGSAEEVQMMVNGWTQDDSPAQQVLVDAGDVVTYARDAMADLAENTEAMKRNWLFRGFFSDRGFYNLDEMTRDELLVDDRYTPLRIWLSADVLFETTEDGERLQLDEGAERRLEEAMGELLDYPRNAPLVVEGYATVGGPGQQFREAQERASAVQAWLTRVFRRSAELTGTMPLGPDAPDSPSGNGRWDGVALTLFAATEELETED